MRLAGLGEVGQRRQRLLEVCDRLAVGRARERLGAGLPEVGDGLSHSFAPERMVGQPVDVLGQPVGIEPLDGLHDPAVEGAPPVLEQAAVGDLVGEGVLERVFDVGEEPRLVEELRGLEGRQTLPEGVLGGLRDGLEKGDGHVLPDDRGHLEKAPCLGRQLVDACGQDRFDRGRHLDRLDRSSQVTRPPLAPQDVGIHQRLHGLLQEERIPLRPLDEERREPARARVLAEEPPEELTGTARVAAGRGGAGCSRSCCPRLC